MSRLIVIPGYESRYSISEEGRVFSIIAGRFLKSQVDKDGYEYVIIRDKHQYKKKHMIHILVYEAFVGQRDRKLVIDHIDNCKTNNHSSNLRQITIRQNSRRGHKIARNVVKNGNRFAVKFHINGKKKHFGTFDFESDAILKAQEVREQFGFKPVLP